MQKQWTGRIVFVLVTSVLVFMAVGMSTPAVSQAPAGRAANIQQVGNPSDVQMVSTLLPSGVQQIVVLDSKQRAIAVYQVDPGQGKLQLKSVRNIAWDLQLEEFNAQSPLPSELRAVQPR